jgi:hypothetical protein
VQRVNAQSRNHCRMPSFLFQSRGQSSRAASTHSGDPPGHPVGGASRWKVIPASVLRAARPQQCSAGGATPGEPHLSVISRLDHETVIGRQAVSICVNHEIG